MFRITQREFSHESRELFTLALDLLEEKEHKVEQKDDTSIYECVGSSSNSCNSRYLIDHSWEKSEQKKSDAHQKKYEKMESIETLTSRDMKGNE